MTSSFSRRRIRSVLVDAVAVLALSVPFAARAAEITLDRDFLAGVAEKLPPVPFEKAGKYRGQVDAFRLVGIDPNKRQVVVACQVAGEFDERAIVSGLKSGKQDGPSASPAPDSKWKAFRFDVKVAVNIEPGPIGAPRFRFEVEDVKREELEGIAGLLARMMGRHFDQIVTSFADKRTGQINNKINSELTKKVAKFTDYGVLGAIDYSRDQLVLHFDVTRLRLETIAGYVYTTQRPDTLPLYRWSSAVRGDHFYAVDSTGPDPRLYRREGIACYVPAQPVTGTVPLYRLWRPRERFYVTHPEAELAVRAGFRFEGLACYVFASEQPDTVPLYRFVDPRNGLHFYTTHPHAEFAK